MPSWEVNVRDMTNLSIQHDVKHRLPIDMIVEDFKKYISDFTANKVPWQKMIVKIYPKGTKKLDDATEVDDVTKARYNGTRIGNFPYFGNGCLIVVDQCLDEQCGTTSSTEEWDNPLEKYICRGGLAHLYQLFGGQGIGLKEFLFLTESDFEKLGVSQAEDRKRLEQLISEIHFSLWIEKSSGDLKPNFRVAEAVKMISNIRGHLVCTEASLLCLRQIADKKQLLPIDRENFKNLMRELDSTIAATPSFDKCLRELRKSLKQMTGLIVDSGPAIDRTNADTKSSKLIENAKKFAIMVSVPLALYVVYRKLMKA